MEPNGRIPPRQTMTAGSMNLRGHTKQFNISKWWSDMIILRFLSSGYEHKAYCVMKQRKERWIQSGNSSPTAASSHICSWILSTVESNSTKVCIPFRLNCPCIIEANSLTFTVRRDLSNPDCVRPHTISSLGSVAAQRLLGRGSLAGQTDFFPKLFPRGLVAELQRSRYSKQQPADKQEGFVCLRASVYSQQTAWISTDETPILLLNCHLLMFP